MTGRIFINGIDAKAAYGLCLRDNAYGEFNKKPQRKFEYTQNWPDQQGTKRFPIDNPVFETRNLSIPVQMRGDNETDFYNKDVAFFELIKLGGIWVVDVEDTGWRYRVIYSATSGETQILDPNRGKGAVSVNLNLELLDDSLGQFVGTVVPGDNNQFTYTFPFYLS